MNFWKLSTIILTIVSLVLFAKVTTPAFQRNTNLDTLNSMKFDYMSDQIIKDTGAKVVVLWATDIEVNSRTVMSMRDDGKSVMELIGYTDKIFSSNPVSNRLIIPLMSGEFSCGQINTTSKVGLYVAKVGAPSICRKGVLKNGLLVGYVSLSFKEMPSDEQAKKIDLYLNGVVKQLVS